MLVRLALAATLVACYEVSMRNGAKITMSWRAKTLIAIYATTAGWMLTLYATTPNAPTLEPSCTDAFGAFFAEHSNCVLDYTPGTDLIVRCKYGTDWLVGNMVADNVGVSAISFVGATKDVQGSCDCARTPACVYK